MVDWALGHQPRAMLRWPRRPTDRAPSGSPAPGDDRAEAPLLDAVRALRSGVAANENFRRIDLAVRGRLESYFASHRFASFDVDELVQVTLAKVYLGVKGLDREERFLGWLFAIARNVRLSALERTARERRRTAGGLDLASGAVDPRPDAMQAEIGREEMGERERRLRAIEATIDALPPQQKSCLLLRVRQEMSYEEIAATLALSVNTVRNHLAAARRSLREQLGTEEVEL